MEFWVKNVFGLKMELSGNINLQYIQNTDLQSLQDNLPSKPHFLPKRPEFYPKILSGHRVFSKSPIFHPKAFFLSKIHSEYQFSFKVPFSTQTPHFYLSNPFRTSFFPKSLILNPNTPFLLDNLFRTSIFPKSPIFDPNIPLLPQNPFRRSTFPKPHFQPKYILYPEVSSEHQQPDSISSTGQHFSNEEQKLARTCFARQT